MLSLFRSVLGAQIDGLAPSVRRRYDLAPGERITSRGEMDTWNRMPWLRLAMPFLPGNHKQVPVELVNIGSIDGNGQPSLEWHREFHYPGGARRMTTVSQMAPTQLACPCVLDTMPATGAFGTAVTLMVAPSADREALAQVAVGPQFMMIAGRRLPQAWLARTRVEAVDHAIDARTYYAEVTIRHALFGKMFGYRGQLTLVDA
jgi:hypothetical protein